MMAEEKQDNSLTLFNKKKSRAINLLYKNELNQNDIGFLNNFFDDYYILKDKQIHEKTNKIENIKLEIYNEILDEIEKSYDDFDSEKSPGFKILQEKEKKHYELLDKGLADVVKVDNTNNGGFATIVLVVGTTIIAGIALGALLWFIR